MPEKEGKDPKIPEQQGTDPKIPKQQGTDPKIPEQQGTDPKIPEQQSKDPPILVDKSIGGIPIPVIVCMAFTAYIAYKTSFTGLYDPIESNTIFTTLRLLKDLTDPFGNASRILWPGGLSGPILYYMHAILLLVFSFIVGLPMEKVSYIPTLILMPLSLPLTYYAIKSISDRGTGIYTVIIMTILPATIHFGHSILPAGPALFMTALTLFLATRCVKTGDNMLALLTGTAAGLAFLIDTPSIVVMIPALSLMTIKFKHLKQIDNIYLTCLPVIILMIPLVIHLMLGFEGPSGGILPELDGVEYYDGHALVQDRFFFTTAMIYGIGPYITLATLLGILLMIWKRDWTSGLAAGYAASALTVLAGLSLTGAMRFYHIYILIIPVAMISSEFMKYAHSFRWINWRLKVVVIALILLPTINYSLNNQLDEEQNIPIGLEVIESVRYKIDDRSIYARASEYLLKTSSPGEKTIASEPMDFYLRFKRPLARYDDDIEIGRDVKYIALNGIDNKRFTRRELSRLKLSQKYDMTQDEGVVMIIIYENKRYVKPNRTAYQLEAESFDLRQAIFSYFTTDSDSV